MNENWINEVIYLELLADPFQTHMYWNVSSTVPL